MNNEIAQAILRTATAPMSATAIAQKVGKSKGYMIQEELEQLVSDGSLKANDSGKYTTYQVVPKNTVTVKNKAKAKTVENSVVTDDAIPSNDRAPDGYIVSKKEVRNKNTKQVGRMITLPNGKKVFVPKDYSIVVINGEPIKCVKTPASALTVIAEYADNHGMTPYTVKSTVTANNVGSTRDITSNCGIIDLKVAKTNKAA